MGQWTNQAEAGTTITTVASYANFTAGSDGDIGFVTATNSYYVYNGAAGLWMQPNVQPSSLISDLDMSVLPTAATPAWTKVGTEGTAIADGVLTITNDSASDYAAYKLYDATNIDQSKNVGMIMRIKVISQSAALFGWKAFMAFQPNLASLGKTPALSMAFYTSLSSVSNVGLMKASNGYLIGGSYPNWSVDNADYQIYYLYYFKDTETVKAGVLDRTDYEYALSLRGFDGSLDQETAYFGSYTTSYQATMDIDYVKLFNF